VDKYEKATKDDKTVNENLLKWLEAQGGWVDPLLSLERCGDAGNGFVARGGAVEEGSLLFKIPASCVITEATVLADPALSKLQKQLSLLRQYSSPLLALFLLLERDRTSASSWKPYLDSLPQSFSVPLYWTWEEILLLRGGPGWNLAVALWKNCVRLYALVYHVCSQHLKELRIKKAPSFASWRWALSCVFTRRNSLPANTKAGAQSGAGSEGILALIPVWDMCNHMEGPLTTGVDSETQQVQSLAMARVEEGNQVFICYGGRSSADLLVHNGFLPVSVTAIGPRDYFPLRLALNPHDPSFAARKTLLQAAQGLPPQADYALRAFAPACAALSFARVARLGVPLPKAEKGLGQTMISQENEKDACALLVTALTIALRKIAPIEEKDGETYIETCCRRLREGERQLVEGFFVELQQYMDGLK
jgi:histone-lysine N-methyltransferase SETD3